MTPTNADLLAMSYRTQEVLEDIEAERDRQDHIWGVQNHPDGTGYGNWASRAEARKDINRWLVEKGNLTWLGILEEEVFEAFAESDPGKLYEELIQVAAVAVAWAEAINRRG